MQLKVPRPVVWEKVIVQLSFHSALRLKDKVYKANGQNGQQLEGEGWKRERGVGGSKEKFETLLLWWSYSI